MVQDERALQEVEEWKRLEGRWYVGFIIDRVV